MSTRSVTQVECEFSRWDFETKANKVETMPLMRFYRHHDGYLDGHGYQMAVALAKAEFDGLSNNRNWAQQFLANLCPAECDIEFEPPTVADGGRCHGDIEYFYTVRGQSDYTGGKEDDPGAPGRVVIEVRDAVGWDVEEDGSYAATLAKPPLFSGTWREYVRWLRSMAMDPGYVDFDYSPGNWICGVMAPEQWDRFLEESR